MDGNRLQIFGPAQIKLNSPNPLAFSPIEGGYGIFKYIPIIVISPMRNNLAVLQAISAGNGLRPAGIESVQDLTNLDLQFMENFHLKWSNMCIFHHENTKFTKDSKRFFNRHHIMFLRVLRVFCGEYPLL